MYKKIVITVLVLISIIPLNKLMAEQRVIYDFEQISDNGGYVILKWYDEDETKSIQITGYSIINENKVEVSYRIGNDVVESNKMFIKNDKIKFPLKIVVKEQKNNTSKLLDLPKNVEKKDHIIHLYDRGVISGYPDKTFRGDEKVTREEFATMVVRAANYEIEQNLESTFYDVNDSDWAKDYIITLAEKKILVGRGNGEFSPKDDITISEVIAVIDRTFRVLNGTEQNVEYPIKEHWSNDNYVSLYQKGIIKEEDLFSKPYTPNKKATREECAILLSRVLEQIYETK
ncbi:MAG: S-layer homology domain-containing protein [Eubacteriales bacterium]